jgi:hypothetical protein
MASPTRAKGIGIVLVFLALMGGVAWMVYERIAHPPPDMSKLAPAFASAPTDVRARIDDAVRAGRSHDYAGSVRALQAVERGGNLSKDQSQVVLFTLTEIRRKVSEQRDDQAALLNEIDELTLKLMSPPE